MCLEVFQSGVGFVAAFVLEIELCVFQLLSLGSEKSPCTTENKKNVCTKFVGVEYPKQLGFWPGHLLESMTRREMFSDLPLLGTMKS
jgi:hypothetical protein